MPTTAKQLKWNNSEEVLVKYALKDSHGTDINMNMKADKTNKVTITTSGAVTQSCNPNTYYNFTGNLTSLTLNLVAPQSGEADIYYITFYVQDTIPTVTVNHPSYSYLRWGAATFDTLTVYTYYELNIVGQVASLIPVSNKYALYKTKTLSNGYYPTSLTPIPNTNTNAFLDYCIFSVRDNTTSTEFDTYIPGGNVVKVIATEKLNVTMDSLTRNGNTITSGSTFMCQSSNTIVASFTGNDMGTITWTVPTGATVTITRYRDTSGSITSGTSVKYGDLIGISVTASSGYTTSFTVNNLTAIPDSSTYYYVSANNPSITITATQS